MGLIQISLLQLLLKRNFSFSEFSSTVALMLEFAGKSSTIALIIASYELAILIGFPRGSSSFLKRILARDSVITAVCLSEDGLLEIVLNI